MNGFFINLLNPLITGAADHSLSDEEAIQHYLATTEVHYFNLLYDRYASKVFAKCISLLKSEQRAEDASQEIFVKILLNLSKFSGKSKFSTWLYSITYNFCIDQIRKEKKKVDQGVEDIGTFGDIEDDKIEDAELLEMQVGRLKTVLDEIPVDDKAILLMKYQDDMSIKDICEILDKSESAIKMKIKRAKEKCMRKYREIYQDVA